MSLPMPSTTRNSISTMPTELKRYIAIKEMRLPRTSRRPTRGCARRQAAGTGNKLITASTREM